MVANIENSFKFVFRDKSWIVKLLVGGVLIMIPIVNFIVLGYLLKVLKDANRFIHYVAKDQEILTQKRNIDDPVEKEQYVKIIDTSSFIKVAQNEFLVPIDEDEDGNPIYNFDINKFDCSTIFEILTNVDEELIDNRFSHLLQKTNGMPYTGAEKKRKVKQLIEKISKLRFGNSFIYPSDILHIPNFKKVDINSI